VEGRRVRERPKKKWLNMIKDMRTAGVWEIGRNGGFG